MLTPRYARVCGLIVACVLAVCLSSIFVLQAATLKGVWEFSNSGNIGLGSTLPDGGASPNLTIVGTAPTYSATLADDSGKVLSGVITTRGGTANRLVLAHGIPGNGPNTSYVHKYTLLFDIFSPSASRSSWRCLFQTNGGNSNDGDYFIRNSDDRMGTAELGYTSSPLPETVWKRVVIVSDISSSFKVYVDGVLFHTHTTPGVGGRYALDPTLLLFADDNSENAALNVGMVAIWDGALTASEVAAMGVAGAAIPLPNRPPVITQGSAVAMTAPSGVVTPQTLNATDPDNNPITWSVTGAAAHGTAVITASSSAQATISYTSTAGYVGTDTFVVTASDGIATASCTVTVTVQPSAPVIVDGEVYDMNATQDGGPRTATFTATDPNNDPLTWTIASPASHGTAVVTNSANTQGTIQYTPAAGYSGLDSFVVRVSDGISADTITVNVTVTNPTAQPVLTVVAARGTATPAPGNYSYPVGTLLTNSVTNEIGTDTRHLCTGWRLTGASPAEGTGLSMSFTIVRDSTLTWQFRTEHRVQLATTGSGSLSVATGFFEGGRPLQITATPATGYYFAGWTGDTAGGTVGGQNLVLPMTRPHGMITAQFLPLEDFTVVALPDTQNYTSISSPTDTFTRQTQWVLDQKQNLNIKFLTHLGDIVNTPSSQSQWQRATDAMNLLNTRLAYGVAPGNHDLATGDTNYITRFGPTPTHSSSTGRWVNPSTSQNYDWYRGASPRGYSSYQVVRVNGRDFLFLTLDMDTPDQDVAWAAGVLAAHPTALAMITTHNYLAETGGSGTYGSGTGQRGYTASANISIPPDRNSPLEIFNALVKPFNQVYMVICGHNFATYNLVKTNNAGNPVHEVVVDYQSLPNGGNGFLRIMQFKPGENKIYNTSYSPSLGRYINPTNPLDHQGMLDLHDPYGSEFVVDLNFADRSKNPLTVVSTYPNVTPGVGVTRMEDGTPVVASAADQVEGGQLRRRAIGWTLTGGQSASGNGNIAQFVQRGASTLTWNWATEYYLATVATGRGIVSVASGWQAADSTVIVQAQPDAGAQFIRWSGDTGGCTVNGSTISIPMNRLRGPVTAEFTSPVTTYSVDVVSQHASVTPAAASYSYEAGTEVTFVADDLVEGAVRRVCTGYSVTGSQTLSGSGRTVTVTVNGNMTVAWNWLTQYLVTPAVSGPGSVTPAVPTWVNAGGSLAVVAAPSAGASFQGWTGDTAAGTVSGNEFTIASANRPVGPITANFSLLPRTLTVVSQYAGATPVTGQTVHPHGTLVNFSAAPVVSGAIRYVPTGWSLSGAVNQSGTGSQGTVTLNGDVTLEWVWSTEVLLEITPGVEGIVLPMNAAGWYPLGTAVTLEARPAPLFDFARWNGDVPSNSTNPVLSLVMNQPRKVTPDITPRKAARGTPWWWLAAHARVINGNYDAAELTDFDGDGQIAADEFLAGTDDLESSFRLQVSSLAWTGNPPKLRLVWTGAAGRQYDALWLAAPGSAPEPLVTGITGVDSEQSVDLTIAGSPLAGFVKLAVRPEPAASGVDADPVAYSHQPKSQSVRRKVRGIPGGLFTRGDNVFGSNASKPAHPVRVDPFVMDQFEVTREEWDRVAAWARLAENGGYDIPFGPELTYGVPGNHPVVGLKWYDAVKWCNARSEMEGRVPSYYADLNGTEVYRSGQLDLTNSQVNWAGNGYRLPTEAEWECASRGGLVGKQYPWGDENALFRAGHWDYWVAVGQPPEYPYTAPVGYWNGTQPGGAPDMANGFGLYDMAGNAWEWTWDRMSAYTAEMQVNPRGPDTGATRVQRGGAWWNYIDQATNAQRLPFPPNGVDDYGMNGFRCVRPYSPNELP